MSEPASPVKVKRPSVKGKQKRHVITVRQEVFDQVVEAQLLVNSLNDQASLALPFRKPTRWTLSEILSLALKDWMEAANRARKAASDLTNATPDRSSQSFKQPSLGMNADGVYDADTHSSPQSRS